MKILEFAVVFLSGVIIFLLMSLGKLRGALRQLNEQIAVSVVEAYEAGLKDSEEIGRRRLDGKNLDERADVINKLIRKGR